MIEARLTLDDYLQLAAQHDAMLAAQAEQRERDEVAKQRERYETARSHIVVVVPELADWRARQPGESDYRYNSGPPEVIFERDFEEFTAQVGGSRYGQSVTLYTIRSGAWGSEWVVAANSGGYVHKDNTREDRALTLALAVRECYHEWSRAEEAEYKATMEAALKDDGPSAEPEPAHVHDFHARLALVRYCYCGESQQEDSWTAGLGVRDE